MMSLPADARWWKKCWPVDGYVVAANKNSPKQTVISGRFRRKKLVSFSRPED
jgi:hypothetical protein